MAAVLALFRAMLGSLRDLLPIVAVIAFFQLAVLQEPLPHLLFVHLIQNTLLLVEREK